MTEAGDNHPPKDDVRDRLARLEADYTHLEKYAHEEIGNLREWRHNIVPPVMAVLQSTTAKNAESISELRSMIKELTLSVTALLPVQTAFHEHQTDCVTRAERTEKKLEAFSDRIEAHFSGARKRQYASLTMLVATMLSLIAYLMETYVLPHAH